MLPNDNGLKKIEQLGGKMAEDYGDTLALSHKRKKKKKKKIYRINDSHRIAINRW